MKSKLIFLLFCYLCFSRAVIASDDQWLSASSSHFTVITNSTEKDARHLVDHFERIRWTLQKLFPKLIADPDDPVIILAFKDDKLFESIAPSSTPAVTGFFVRGNDRNYIAIKLDTQQTLPAASINQEYVHLEFRKIESRLPLWLLRGVTHFYQDAAVNEKAVVVGQPSAKDIAVLRQSQLIPLQLLLNADRNSPYAHDDQNANLFDAESWALTHYLLTNDIAQNTQKMAEYLTAVNKGAEPASATEAAFGALNGLNSKLEAYVHAGQYKPIQLDSSVAPLDESYYKVQPINQSDMDAYRAELLSQEGRSGEAKTILDEILKDGQTNSIASQVRGTIALHENDRNLALRLFNQAFQGGYHSQGFLARYATFLMEFGMDDEKKAQVEAVLRKQIQLYPKNPVPFDQLAGILRFEPKSAAEARKLEQQAIDNEPSNLHYRLNLEGILITQKQFDEARVVLLTAKKIFVAETDQKQIEDQLGKIEEFIAASKKQEELKQSNSGTVTIETGQVVTAANAPKHPSGPAAGPKHTIEGVVRGVVCNIPSQMDLTLVTPKKTFTLYSMNYFKIEFSTLNFNATDNFDPCKMDGLHAKITYAENPDDATVDGEAQSILLKK